MRLGRQFVTFGLVGVVNTVIQYAVFVLLFRLAGVPLLLASAVGYACGLVNSYLMNRRWTFRPDRARSRSEFLRFCLVNLVALGVNLLVLKSLTAARILPEIAQLVAIGASLVVNFAGNRWWTFADRPRDGALRAAAPYVILVLLVGPLVFWHLDSTPLRDWDESRLAMNSLEMFLDGDWLVTHFGGEPDLWNTKPPLLIWMQAATMGLVGPGDLAVRLPSALAALLTVLVVFAFCRRYLADDRFAMVAALVLATSPGFMGLHAARGGDYDVPMALMTTIACLAFFLYVEDRRARHLYVFAAALALAMLTKGVGAVLLLPALGIYTLVRRRLPTMLRDRHLYVALAIVVVVVGGFYGLRELAGPGYLAAVYGNELGGRYLEATENHREEATFFLANLWRARLPYWVALVPIGIVVCFLQEDSRRTRLTWFAALAAVCFFAVISSSQTKCRWYDVPAYPFLAIVVASLVVTLLERARLLLPPWTRSWLPLVLLVALFATPYRAAWKMASAPENNRGFYLTGYALKEALAGQRDLDGVGVVLEGYSPWNEFYIRILRERGVDVARRDWRELSPGDRVIAPVGPMADAVAETYEHVLVDESHRIRTFEIRGRRAP